MIPAAGERYAPVRRDLEPDRAVLALCLAVLSNVVGFAACVVGYHFAWRLALRSVGTSSFVILDHVHEAILVGVTLAFAPIAVAATAVVLARRDLSRLAEHRIDPVAAPRLRCAIVLSLFGLLMGVGAGLVPLYPVLLVFRLYGER